MINWFRKKDSQSVQNLHLSGEVSISDVISLSEASSIPGEAIEADFKTLKRFFTDEAWKRVLELRQLECFWEFLEPKFCRLELFTHSYIRNLQYRTDQSNTTFYKTISLRSQPCRQYYQQMLQ